MNKIQPVKFKNVEDMLDYVPSSERKVAESLRALIKDCLPKASEKLAYNVPFYYRHSRICFIWPASVPWGGIDEGVALGFCRGHLLRDETGYLQNGNRKEVFTKNFMNAEQIEEDLLRAYLFEVWDLDEKLAKK